MFKRKSSSIEPANVYNNSNSAFEADFNITSLEQTDVIDVIEGKYNSRYHINLIKAGLSNKILIDEVVELLEQNIVALADDKGIPFATGLLIHPQFVLTARHSLEEKDLTNLVVRCGYQKNNSGILDYGTIIPNLGVVEENLELDFAIIRLNSKVSVQKVDLASSINHFGGSIFFHHPGGEPKKVSVYQNPEVVNKKLQYNAFHDSAKGLSGGVYINASGKVFALHCLNKNGTIGAQPIERIYEKSSILQALYDNHGQAKKLILLRVRAGEYFLPKSIYSEGYHQYLDVLWGKPEGLLGVNDGREFGQEKLAYHHIIPKANLEFLWMLGREYSDIKRLLKPLAWQDDFTKKEELIENNIIWAPWNLFIGPSERPYSDSKSYDSHNNLRLEATKPLSFNKDLWDKISRLNQCIENCWSARKEFSQLTKEELFRKLGRVRNRINHSVNQCNEAILSKVTVRVFDNYNEQLSKLIIALGDLKIANPKNIHKTLDSDWSFRINKNRTKEYLLRRNENDREPVVGVMNFDKKVQDPNNRNFAHEVTRRREAELKEVRLPDIGSR